jgi:phosphoenolpyruvate synthase/pyruvate phosphate dikinase
MAVVIQEMVNCDSAGVIFTCNPINGDERLITITANYGLGEVSLTIIFLIISYTLKSLFKNLKKVVLITVIITSNNYLLIILYDIF